MRIGAIDLGNILKKEITEFTNKNVFVLRAVPQTILQNKSLPFVQISSLGNDAYTYSSNKTNGEVTSSQIDIYCKDNRSVEEYLKKLTEILPKYDFSLYYFTFDTNVEYGFQVLHLRVNRYQTLKYMK